MHTAALDHFDARHLAGAALLAGLLIVLPIFDIGPSTWQQGSAIDAVAGAGPLQPQASAVPPAPADAKAASSEAKPLASLPARPSAAQSATGPFAAMPPRENVSTRPSSAAAVAAPPETQAAAADPTPKPAATQAAAADAAPTPPATQATAADAAPAPAATGAPPRAVIYFAFNADTVTRDARRKLAPVAAYLKTHPDRRAQISGFHDARGQRLYNEDLAERREEAVRAALVRAGVRRDRIVVVKPARTTGSGTPDEARRTEVAIVP